MNNSKYGMKKKLINMVLMPIIILTAILILIASLLISHFATTNQKDTLAATNNILHECLELTIPGDYSFSNGILTKGNVNINDATLLFALSNNSDIHSTIFWKDTRVLTTIEDDYGISAIGTTADPEITQKVLENGYPYFSNNITISGRRYVGYYAPLRNSDNSIVGMIFTGTPLESVLQNILSAVLLFLALAALTALIAIKIINTYTGKLSLDINSLKNFLHNISKANFSDDSIENPINRDDEIGEIGFYAQDMAKSLREYIQYDTLTKLYNRRTGMLKMEELSAAKSSYVLALCDIDYFKKINDTYGHDCGDYILQEMSALFRENTADCGFASRWGGEEFLLVYHTNRLDGIKHAEELLETVREHEFKYNNKTLRATITIGISECISPVTYSRALKLADDNLYEGKTNGRNTLIY